MHPFFDLTSYVHSNFTIYKDKRMPGKIIKEACADCQSAEATLDIRKRRLCPDCFSRYVNSKVLKRMESYRFKNLENDQKRRLLLPVSGGVSSMALLQILDTQLRKQIASRNRTAYDLVVVYVMMPGTDMASSSSWVELVRKRFPMHIDQPSLHLSDIFNLYPAIEADLSHFGLQTLKDKSAVEKLQHVMSFAKSTTAYSDVRELLLTRLLVAFAKQHDCEAILWGHSDSRLAAKALAGVAKGRGGALPFDICDGLTPWDLYFNYPLRDLFQSELYTYASVYPVIFTGLIQENPVGHTPTSIRHTSIDDLLTDYIISQGEKYPSIMANVVRTASKLQCPPIGQSSSHCAVCAMPHGHIASDKVRDTMLCYACARIKQDIKTEDH